MSHKPARGVHYLGYMRRSVATRHSKRIDVNRCGYQQDGLRLRQMYGAFKLNYRIVTD